MRSGPAFRVGFLIVRRTRFELLVGTDGDLRRAPVRISYRPNWRFQVVLNLKTPETSERVASSAMEHSSN